MSNRNSGGRRRNKARDEASFPPSGKQKEGGVEAAAEGMKRNEREKDKGGGGRGKRERTRFISSLCCVSPSVDDDNAIDSPASGHL